MADGPLAKLIRLGGGVALLSGPLGQQVIGQLLISRSTMVEVAGANVALAAVSRHSNVAVQLALNTAVPALVIELLSRKEERRLEMQRHRLERLAQEQAPSTPFAPMTIGPSSSLPDEIAQALARNAGRPADAAREP